jgi:hypothetical protein
MANPNLDDADDKPLDPAVARVQARLRRLLLIAALTLGLGLVAVFVGIIYRLSGPGDKPLEASRAAGEAAYPDGARLVSTVAAGDRLVLTFEHTGGTTLVFVNARTQAVIGRLDLLPGDVPPPPPNAP